MRWLIRLLVVSLLFLVLDAALLWHFKPEAFSSRAAMQETGTELLAQVLARTLKLRIKLPQQLNDSMRLVDVEADRTKVIYSLSVNASGDAFESIARNIGDDMRTNGCARADYRKLLAYGLTIVLSLHAVDGTVAAPIIVSPEGCKG